MKEEIGLVEVELVVEGHAASFEPAAAKQQQPAPTEDAPKDRHILRCTLFRRRGSRVTLSETAPPQSAGPCVAPPGPSDRHRSERGLPGSWVEQREAWAVRP